MLPNIWQLTPGRRVSPLGVHGLGSGKPKAPWERIAELATEDGWHATYDPGNPDYRVLEEDNGTPVIRQLSDVMENLRAIGDTDSTAMGLTQSPYYHKNSLGKLDAIECHDRDAQDRRLFLPTLSPTIAQPYFIMAVVRNQPGGGTKSVFTKGDSFNLNRTTGVDFGLDEYRTGVSAGTLSFNQGGATDHKTTLIGVQVNGASSQTYVNGVANAAGDVSGTDALSGFTLGANELANSNFWDGLIGPILIYDGTPSTAVRQRMENLLLKLAEPETYDIPEALNLEGLALWLDGSDETTLRDAAGDPVAADGAIFRWFDKSDNSRPVTQATSAARPVRKTDVQNGLDVVRFDGTDDQLDIGNLPGLINNTSGITVFAVRKITSSASVNQLLQISNGVSETGVRFASLALDTEEMRITGRRLDTDTGGLLDTSGDPHGAGFEIQSSFIDWQNRIARLKLDGVTLAEDLAYDSDSGAGNWDSTDPLAAKLGTNLAETVFLDGDYAELVIYDRPLTSQEETDVLEYLQSKWATPALP